MFEPEILHFQNAEDWSRDIASGMYIHVYIYITPANCKLFYSEETSLTHHIDIHTVGKIYCSLRDFGVFYFCLLTVNEIQYFFVL